MQVITLNTHTQGLYFTVAPVFVRLIHCTDIREVKLQFEPSSHFPSVLTLVLRDCGSRTQPANAISRPAGDPLSHLSINYLSFPFHALRISLPFPFLSTGQRA